jgi:hypothetical protein
LEFGPQKSAINNIKDVTGTAYISKDPKVISNSKKYENSPAKS